MTAANLPDDHDQATTVQRMFGAIAPRYDLLNHLLSLNIDRRWRKRAVDVLVQGLRPSGRFLDVCAGTFDLSVELARRSGFHGVVVGSDFAFPMLAQGAPKIQREDVVPACADTLRLPFRSHSFDGAMVAFGVRNLADLDKGLREVARVLRPGGRFVVLEFTVPAWRPFRALYLTYFTQVLPRIGRLVSRHANAYAYLPASVLDFPAPAELAARMEGVGFAGVHWQTLTGGIAAIHVGTAWQP